MKKRVLFLTMSLGLTVAMLSGCGKATAESLINGMYEKEMESATVNTSIDIDISAESDGETLDAAITGDFETQMSGLKEDEKVYYVNGSVALESDMFDYDLPMETYMVMSEDGNTIYNYSEDADEWSYTESDEDAGALDDEMVKDVREAFQSSIADAELQDDTEDVEGEECYVLTLSTTADNFEGVMDAITESMADELEDADLDTDSYKEYLEYVNVDLKLYISKKDGYCAGVEIDLAGTDTEGLLEAADAEGSLEINAFNVKATLSDVDNTEVAVPDEVKDDAVESDSVNFGDLGSMLGSASYEEPEVEEPDVEDPDVEDPDVEDPDVEDPDIEEPEEDPYADNDEYTNADGSATLHDDYGVVLLDCYPLDGYQVDDPYCYDDYLCFCRPEDEYDYYRVSDTAPYQLDEYLKEGTTEFDSYEDYSVEITELDPICGGSIQPYWAHESYLYSDYQFEYDYIYFEYVDDGDYQEFVTVSFDGFSTDDWSQADFNNAAQTIFGE